MPMIDVYATAGTFAVPNSLAQQLAETLMRIEEVPASIGVLNAARPLYEEFPGWDEPLAKARSLDDLPVNARRYLTALEELTATPFFMVSVGARRQDTIILRNAFTG